MIPPIGIRSASYYLPPEKRRVADILREEEVPREPFAPGIDFHRDLGIESVHVGGDDLPSTIGLRAARRAVTEAGIDPADLDLIVDFTSIPEDHVAPTWSAAGRIQEELGARRALATAVNTGGCTSYHVALKTACALLAGSENARFALLFSGDKTPRSNHTYFPITVTCDGGSAVVLEKGHDRNVILSIEIATLGELHDVWYVPGIGNRLRGEPAGERCLHMKSDLRRFQSSVIPVNLFMFRKVMKAALKRAGIAASDVKLYVYPTFSTWDLRSFCEGLSIPRELVTVSGLRSRGHLQENDMVVNFVDAVKEGRVREGDPIVITTNGAGFVWGAAVVRH